MSAWVADRAKSVSAVVLDPYTGEVLAEATYPSYDANDYAAIASRRPLTIWLESFGTSRNRTSSSMNCSTLLPSAAAGR